ncbi:hypothetical protein CAPTEDRAFT_108943 [Capitella teleta]|uniref:ARID domain-containing protein n=1 Tax=Capitella teleta TaxID=283909 RepID=R7V9M0_CAPTE|nr:hypothetical protein CAPTEDRAFT_108943 [Capitella teleta]|eukprot:ELU12445.1 hypothetical protein CAPTEDRAFT_108943 [Capitella teleta]
MAAKMMNKDPFTYHSERDSFVKALQSFHSSRGTTIVRLPTIGGREIDLFLLYSKVTALGGWEKVMQPNQALR